MKFGTFGPSKLVASATSTPTTPTAPSVRLCLFGCLSVAAITPEPFKFSGHHPMVEKADTLEHGYIEVRGW